MDDSYIHSQKLFFINYLVFNLKPILEITKIPTLMFVYSLLL